MLSELLPSVDRVVVLPVDAVVTGDVAELYDLTWGSTWSRRPPSSAPPGRAGSASSTTRRCGSVPGPVAATELRRQAYARHTFDFDAFTTDVLVLDLARARSEGFLDECLPYVDEFGLTLRAGAALRRRPDRTVLPGAVGLRADALGG